MACYTYNIKVEEMIYDIYYRKSADTVFILNKSTDFETAVVGLPSSVRTSLYSQIMGDVTLSETSYEDTIDEYLSSIEQVTRATSSWVVFNSSFYAKDLYLELESNNSDKLIDTTTYHFRIDALDCRIITIGEDIDLSKYVGGYGSGMATFRV